MSGATRGYKRVIRLIRSIKPLLGGSYRRLVALALSSTLAGFIEAAVLVIVVYSAVAIADDRGPGTLDLGPVSHRFTTLEFLLLGLVLITVKLLIEALVSYLNARTAGDAQAILRNDVYRAFLNTSWGLQSAEPEGRLQEILLGQATRAASVVAAIANSFGSGFSFLALLVSAFFVNPLAAAVIVVTVIVLFYALRPVSQIGRRYAKRHMDASVAYAKVVSESVNTVQEVQTFGVKDELARRVAELVSVVQRIARRTLFWQSLLPRLYQTVVLLLLLAGLATFSVAGSGSVAGLGAIVLMLLRAMSYSQQLQSTYHGLMEAAPYFSTVREARERYGSATPTDGSKPLPAIETVAFDAVSFSYGATRALDTVSFSVTAGAMIGIVGPSGSGKSTLVQLLLRLRDPQEGRLLVNGVDLREYSLRDWRRLTSFAPQESRLIDAPISENIDFFRGVPQAQIEDAARRAHIHEDIESLPDGYATPAGRGGGKLSGGQRQRVNIARALAHEPQLLILDEPTSALDPVTESFLQKTLRDLKGRTTIFVIAHRISTLEACDKILVLRAGRLERFASAKTLLESDNFYREAVEISQSTAS